MKLAIISDIHDNLVNLKKCLDWCRENKVEEMICCGDVTNNETLQFLSQNFFGPIHLVRGNMEIYYDEEVESYKNVKYYGRTGRVKIGDKFFGLCHEPFLIEDVQKLGDCEIIFYGHTHKPWEELQNGVKIVNPGTLGGVFQRATFAVWEDGSLTLKILELV